MNNSKPPIMMFNPQQIINQFNGFYAVTSLNHENLLINKTAAEWLGYETPEEAIGINYSNIEISATESSNFFQTIDKKIIKDRTRVVYLGYFGYHDKYRLIQGTNSPFLNEENQIVGVISQVQDVTKFNLINRNILGILQRNEHLVS